ncbi:MAG: glycosyltransferase family 4 protein, partial [Chitinophagaceae bacterium]|nr:glycosyltransferase family 4 protein [Chitinophagaceae bacterium]
MSRLSIVSIIPYKILPAKLGGEKGIAVFNEYLSREVNLVGVTTQNNDPALAKGYKLLNILSDSRLRYVNLFLYFRIRRILLNEKATHLLIEHPYYGWLAWLLRRTMPIKLIVHSHNIEYMRSKSIGRSWWKLLKWYEGWVYRSADKVFFISDDDRDFAGKELNVRADKSMTVTFGIELSGVPSDISEKRGAVERLHGIDPSEKILLFNGALYHSTNYDALRVILDEINPLVLSTAGFRYKIIVCGKGLPDFFNELKDYEDKNVIYAGFVDDISMYFKAADIFLNPILTGGGVKTKAIEALAMNCTVISTELGAMGIKEEVCGKKLLIVKEGEWKRFRDLIVSISDKNDQIPESFFQYYY